MWMVSSHSSRLVHESVVKWTTGMVHMVLWQQVQGPRQGPWYLGYSSRCSKAIGNLGQAIPVHRL